MKFESLKEYDEDMCIAVVDDVGSSGDGTDGCDEAPLGLAPCDDPKSSWYNTGGQLLSVYCLDFDYSSVMYGDCTDFEVSETDAFGPGETFMFLENE